MADRRAKQALELDDITHIPTNHKDILPHLRRAIDLCFARTWQQTRHTFLKLIKPETGDWVTAYRKSRKEEVTMARLRTGHTRLTHGALMNGEPRPVCTTCNVPLTVFHVLLECRMYVGGRRTLKGHFTTHRIPFDLPHLLGNGNPSATDAVCAFMKKTRLLDEI